MKYIYIIKGLLFFSTIQSVEAQLFERLKKRAEEKVEQKVEQKVTQKIEKETDDILEGKKSKKKKKNRRNTSKGPIIGKKPTSVGSNPNKDKKEVTVWRNYKFIPGEKIIFYDDLKNEEIGEFPSRWDLKGGGFEIANLNNQKVIMVTNDHNSNILPLFNKNVYLPDEFTIEFDLFVDKVSENTTGWNSYYLFFSLNQQQYSAITINMELARGYVGGSIQGTNIKIERTAIDQTTGWNHISMSYHKGKVKIYINDKRILNIPRLSIKPGAFSIGMGSVGNGESGSKRISAIKNIKIAEGGGSLYKRIIADGKYATHGILFDSGKAILKPQSAGVISKLKILMQENPDWKFNIIGHTDSDGDSNLNLKLSKERAEAVKIELVKQGINTDRLFADGEGESKPLNNNITVEEKANNRRVEFVRVQ